MPYSEGSGTLGMERREGGDAATPPSPGDCTACVKDMSLETCMRCSYVTLFICTYTERFLMFEAILRLSHLSLACNMLKVHSAEMVLLALESVSIY